MLHLHHCLSARSFRPLWMLEELQLPYQLHMLPFPPRALARSFLELNPLGTVPLLTQGDVRMTESAAMSDPAAAVATLNHYRERGIAVSMDDYGTGQSTLSYIRELPLNELKIDRSFVQHAHERSEDAALVRSTVELAHTLGLKVVAEGIEDAANLAFLKSIRCDYAQGYFISRPVPVEALMTLLATPRASAA